MSKRGNRKGVDRRTDWRSPATRETEARLADLKAELRDLLFYSTQYSAISVSCSARTPSDRLFKISVSIEDPRHRLYTRAQLLEYATPRNSGPWPNRRSTPPPRGSLTGRRTRPTSSAHSTPRRPAVTRLAIFVLFSLVFAAIFLLPSAHALGWGVLLLPSFLWPAACIGLGGGALLTLITTLKGE